MKKSTILIIALLTSVLVVAQDPSLYKLADVQNDGSWIKMLPESNIAIDKFFEDFQDDLGLDQHYHFELLSMKEDKLGFSHYRYQEHFKGYPIEGGTYILHVKDGLVKYGNGKVIRGLSESNASFLSAEEGLEKAKKHTGAKKFYWEIPEMEMRIKHIKKDENASFYPQAKQVYADSKYTSDGKNYALAWKYEVYTAQPEGREIIYIDAGSGEVLFDLQGCHSGSVEATAETHYHGIQNIITDSISPTEYRLIDATRGSGIETYDMNGNVDDYSLAVDFVDEDNYWNNINDEWDEAATDAHWGAEMFYDYFLQDLGRDSYDGNGSAIINYIHYDEDYVNAFWNGLYATYGDGNNNPLTTIDIVAHEFTHGVTEFSAGLIYQDESGALNESFSDIFGTTVEFFGLPSEADWLIGVPGLEFRDMSNPNDYGDPDTYQGTNWVSGFQDNGGVHSNSGVQNFWFYLLSNGGTGINDNSDEYTVDSLGMETAAAIAYRNLNVYLTESSNYIDARIGSLQAAEDLYGTCSEEVIQVAKAWHAVGVGPLNFTPDLQAVEVLSPLFSSCDLGSQEQMSMVYRFNPSGCGFSLDVGAEIELSYKINDQDPIFESIVLTEPLNEGELIIHDFQTLADLSVADQYSLDFSVNFTEDLTPSNNNLTEFKLTNPHIFPGGNILSFTSINAKDSIYVNLGTQAQGAVKTNSGNNWTKGFQMNGVEASEDNITFIDNEDDNFMANPDFTAQVCSCVDLSGWDEAFLNFDLRQTFSEIYLNEFELDIDYMIAFRVTANDQQIGEQFHPLSNFSDVYQTHVIDMSTYSGSSFTLCFEAVNFFYEEDDFPNEGDKATLDNVYFSQSNPVGLETYELSEVDVYPNPSSGLMTIELNRNGMYQMQVMDLLGHVVRTYQWMANGSPYTMDLSSLAKGSYMLSITSEEGHVVQRVVLI